ncbi:MAG: nucleotide exchange factor GrpE, partial [Candidatus Diapherotrites archaeon]|nr:nucleotide exchange factor GrpE [Candidatus Diapherotrites archaeon]
MFEKKPVQNAQNAQTQQNAQVENKDSEKQKLFENLISFVKKEEIPHKEEKLLQQSEGQGKVQLLEKQVQELNAKIADYTNILQRLQAEFENYKKRTEKEQMHFREFANANFASEFLPLLDSLESGVQAIRKSEKYGKEEALKGFTAFQSQFQTLMKKHGIEEIKSYAQKFNPEFHEALMQGADEKQKDEAVLEEFQKGYTFRGKVIRHSKVKVNKLPDKNEQNKPEEK